MSWLRIDDRFEVHEKVVDLSDAAHRLWFRCACWCSLSANEATSGFIPTARVLEFCGGSQAKARKLSNELIESKGLPQHGHEHGLWEKADGGWRFHDWADYRPRNLSEEEKTQLKQARSEAGKRGAASRWSDKTDGNSDSKPDGKFAIDPIANPRQTGWQKNAPVSRIPYPVPGSLGSSNEKLRGDQLGSAHDDGWVPTPSETQFGAARDPVTSGSREATVAPPQRRVVESAPSLGCLAPVGEAKPATVAPSAGSATQLQRDAEDVLAGGGRRLNVRERRGGDARLWPELAPLLGRSTEHPPLRDTDGRVQRILERLADGFTVAELLAVLQAAEVHPGFWRGKDLHAVLKDPANFGEILKPKLLAKPQRQPDPDDGGALMARLFARGKAAAE